MFRVKHCREVSFKLLYQIDVRKLEDSDIPEMMKENCNLLEGLNTNEQKFVDDIVNYSLKEKEMISQLISSNLIAWKLSRLMAVDRCLLKLGIAESSFNDQKAIIIDDVVRIAKKYGGEESYKMINAILDKAIA